MEIEAHCVELENPYEPARISFDALVTKLSSIGSHQLTHSELETTIKTDGIEVMRLLLQGHLDERGPGESSITVVNSKGKVLPYKRERGRYLESIFGTVRLNRTGYEASSNLRVCRLPLIPRKPYLSRRSLLAFLVFQNLGQQRTPPVVTAFWLRFGLVLLAELAIILSAFIQGLTQGEKGRMPLS